MIAHELRGEVDLRLPATEVECDITVPTADVEVAVLGENRVEAA